MDKGNNEPEINRKIIDSLEDLIFICRELNCQFRIFGSLIPAALKGEFYREIGDIDCFIGKEFKEDIADRFKKIGYIKSTKRDEDIPTFLYFLGFRTETFIKDNNKLSLLFVSFKEEYMEISLRFGLSFRTPYNLINKTYKFFGKEFKGSIPEAALFLFPFAKDKTKRRIDFDALFPFCNPNAIQKIKNTNTFFWFGKRLPLISKILASKIDKLFLNKF